MGLIFQTNCFIGGEVNTKHKSSTNDRKEIYKLKFRTLVPKLQVYFPSEELQIYDKKRGNGHLKKFVEGKPFDGSMGTKIDHFFILTFQKI